MAARGGAYFSPNVYIANLNIFSLETARQIERNLAEILLWWPSIEIVKYFAIHEKHGVQGGWGCFSFTICL